MSDLDARVAALLRKLAYYRYVPIELAVEKLVELEQAIRAELQKPAQEEIGRLRGALELMVQYLEMPISVQMTKQQLIIKLRAAIRASKGEKT